MRHNTLTKARRWRLNGDFAATSGSIRRKEGRLRAPTRTTRACATRAFFCRWRRQRVGCVGGLARGA